MCKTKKRRKGKEVGEFNSFLSPFSWTRVRLGFYDDELLLHLALPVGSLSRLAAVLPDFSFTSASVYLRLYIILGGKAIPGNFTFYPREGTVMNFRLSRYCQSAWPGQFTYYGSSVQDVPAI